MMRVKDPLWRRAMEPLRPLLPARFDEFLDALTAATLEIAAARPPEFREVPIVERYHRALLQLGIDDAGLAGRLADAQIAALPAHAHLPAEHAALLRSLHARY